MSRFRSTRRERPGSASGSSVSGRDVSGIGIAMGQGAEAHVTVHGDLNYFPAQSRAPLRSVFAPLIADRTAAFGGRQPELEAVADFLAQPGGGYLAVTAPAGFGKTALAAAVVDTATFPVAYHFFTSTYGDLSEQFFLRNMIEQLAAWHGRTGELPTDLISLRALYHDLLDKPLDGTRVLLLDGVDEVTGWPLAPYVGRPLGPASKAVFTVRDVGQDWRGEYGVPSQQTNELRLDGLTPSQVADVWRRFGPATTAVVNDQRRLGELARVCTASQTSAGGADPFYVRLLAEDVAASVLRAEDIATRPAGLDAFLDRWWTALEAELGSAELRDTLGLMTVALGPLRQEEIEELLPDIRDLWSRSYFERVVVRPIRRFLVGDDEHGYALIHPRLRDYMRKHIRTEQYEARLIEYCRDWSEHGSRYALRHLPEHLVRAGQSSELYELIGPAWVQAKLGATRSPLAVTTDLQLGFDVAARSLPGDLPDLVRLALAMADLAEDAGAVPPLSLEVLAAAGESDRAIAVACAVSRVDARVAALLAVSRGLITVGDSVRALECLIDATNAIRRLPAVDRAAAAGEAARSWVRLGDPVAAIRVLEEVAAELIGLEQEHPGAIKAIASVATHLADLGEVHLSAQLLLAAEQWVFDARPGRPHGSPADLAQALVDAGDDQRALAIAERDIARGMSVDPKLVGLVARLDDISRALTLAERKHSRVVECLVEIADVLSKVGDDDRARSLLARARESLFEPLGFVFDVGPLTALVLRLQGRDALLELVAESHRRSRQDLAALDLRESKRRTEDDFWLRLGAAEALAASGYDFDALQIADGLSDWPPTVILDKAAVAKTRTGAWQEGITLARRAGASTMAEVSEALLARGRRDDAAALAEEALASVSGGHGHPSVILTALLKLSMQLAAVGESRLAREMLQWAEAASGELIGSERVSFLVEASDVWRTLPDSEEAIRVARAAFKWVIPLADEQYLRDKWPELFVDVGLALCRAGDEDCGLGLIRRAVKHVHGEERARGLGKVVSLLAERGQYDLAFEAVDIETTGFWMAWLAEHLASHGETSKGAVAAERAVTMGRADKQVVRALVLIGAEKSALEIARSTNEDVDDDAFDKRLSGYDRSHLLAVASVACAEVGKPERAAALADEALALSDSENPYRSWVAEALACAGDPLRAVSALEPTHELAWLAPRMIRALVEANLLTQARELVEADRSLAAAYALTRSLAISGWADEAFQRAAGSTRQLVELTRVFALELRDVDGTCAGLTRVISAAKDDGLTALLGVVGDLSECIAIAGSRDSLVGVGAACFEVAKNQLSDKK